MTRIVVLGSNGMLGRYISVYHQRKKEYEVVNVDRSMHDFNRFSLIDDVNFLRDLIGRGDRVFNGIGITNKRIIDIKDMMYVNAMLPSIIANICHERDAILIHPSTDCIFTGSFGGYDRHSIPDNHNDSYGLSKLLGENAVCHHPSVITIRSSIIGEDDKQDGLLEWVLHVPPSHISPTHGYTNHIWNGITCLTWVKEAERFIEQKAYGLHIIISWTRIPSSHSETEITKHTLLSIIKDIYGLNHITIIPSEGVTSIKRNLAISDDGYTHDRVTDLSIESQIKEQYDFDVLNRR